MTLFKRLLAEPLLHFIVAGFVLYFLATWLRGPDLMPVDERVIQIERDSLLAFMQFRANAFDSDIFAERLDSLSPTELDLLIADYVNEEVLYREASSLGLQESDYIIRQRMVDKMRFLLMDLSGAAAAPTDEELLAYFQSRKSDYRIEPSASFTHVFFDVGKHGRQPALALAQTSRDALNASAAGFNAVMEDGDRFPFLRNYVERTLNYIGNHFGSGFVAELQNMHAGDKWQGPVESEYGFHVVLLTHLTQARDPEFAEVHEQVARDFLESRSEQQFADMLQSVSKRYQIQRGSLQP